MRFGFVTLGARVPSTRFRFEAMLPYLKQQGHACRMWTSWPSVYEHFPSIGWRASQLIKRAVRWQQLLDAQRFRPDCVYLERGVFHTTDLKMDRRFRRATPRLVLDVDDGIFLEFPDKIPQLISMSDHVVVSTPTIAEYVSQYTSALTLIPTAVSLARYQPKPDVGSPTARPVVGWIGTAPNIAFLEVAASGLRELAKRMDFELLVVANHDEPLRKLNLSGVQVRFERWSPDHEIKHLHSMDVGIMPLPEGKEWMRYKAATKLIQYLSVGIPAVASPIGVNADILKGESVGLAATTDIDWCEQLYRLLSDPMLRKRMGSAGRQLVAEQFSIEALAPRLENILIG